MKFEVTQAHIDNGVPTKCSYCPVALAIYDKLPLPQFSVAVTQNEIFIKGELFYTPLTVAEFISFFDKGLPVEPFTFELPIGANQ